MKKLACLISTLGFLTACSHHTAHRATCELKVSQIDKYKIKLPDALLKASGGFSPGIGSGLLFDKKLANGHLQFYAISDRGPNFSMENESKIVSFNPNYTPLIVRIDVDPSGQAQVVDFLPLKNGGRLITGLNPSQDATDEVMYDQDLKKLSTSFGLDTESLGRLKNGNFVVGDEYFPSINIIDHKTGNIIHSFTPGNGLPDILKYRNFNKGFEAVTVAPNDKIYALLEGVLNLDEASVKTAKLIRMIEIDPQTRETRMFAYPFDSTKYTNSSKVKVGDLTALDDTTFLLVEQGVAADGVFYNLIYRVGIKDATDISHLKLSKELEHVDITALEGLRLPTKELIFNPRLHGWTDKKLEGLTVVTPKPLTLAISNDNDFALSGYEVVEQPCKNGRCKKIMPKIDEAKRETNLWVIHFEND